MPRGCWWRGPSRGEVSLSAGAQTSPPLQDVAQLTESNQESRHPTLNYNATELLFDSEASNLVQNDANAFSDVFQRTLPDRTDVVFIAGFE